MASRDVPAFPREERHHRAPVGTRVRCMYIIHIYGGFGGTREDRAKGSIYTYICVCVRAIFISFLHVPFFWEMEGDDFAGLVLRSVEITR